MLRCHKLPTTNLFQKTVDLITVGHLKHFWCTIWINCIPIKQETYSRHVDPLVLSVGIKDFLEFRFELDFEFEVFAILFKNAEKERPSKWK